MKLNQANIGDIVLLPVKVMKHAWSNSAVHVEFDEGPEGKTTMLFNQYTEVHPLVALSEAAHPIEIDDIVFVAFEDGQWRVADRYQDQLFLTPHMDVAEALSNHPRTAMLADAEDCYHVSPKGGW